jgi:hypothetical protein
MSIFIRPNSPTWKLKPSITRIATPASVKKVGDLQPVDGDTKQQRKNNNIQN